MTMTREEMLKLQAIKPKKTFFRVNRKGICDRAVETLVRLGSAGADIETVHHAHLAPLTTQEKKDARATAADIWKEFQEKRAAGAK